MATTNEKILSGVLIAVIVVAAVVLTITVTQSITSSGEIVSNNPDLGIYQDATCTVKVTSVDWGKLKPTQTASAIFYAKNTGNTNLTLSFNVTNWTPTVAATYLTLSWNYVANSTVLPNQVVPITLYLAVSPNVSDVTVFSSRINVMGTYTAT